VAKYNINNHFGTIIDIIEAETSDDAMRIYRTKHDLTQDQIEQVGHTVENREPKTVQIAPKNGEVWETKSGNIVLIVERPVSADPEIGFVWLDPIDKTLCYTAVLSQLSRRVNISITEWGMMMQAWMPPPVPL